MTTNAAISVAVGIGLARSYHCGATPAPRTGANDTLAYVLDMAFMQANQAIGPEY